MRFSKLGGSAGSVPLTLSIVDKPELGRLGVVSGIDFSYLSPTGARLVRLATPSVWEALATAILRQVIKAEQARKLIAGFRAELGEEVAGYRCFPLVDAVTNASNDLYTRLGLSFFQSALQNAATWMQDYEPCAPDELLTELLSIPRIGPWTAGVVVADVTNDFSFYPQSDRAIRLRASGLSDKRPWSTDGRKFEQEWRALTGVDNSACTMLALADEP